MLKSSEEMKPGGTKCKSAVGAFVPVSDKGQRGWPVFL